jgi:hypothetical protein
LPRIEPTLPLLPPEDETKFVFTLEENPFGLAEVIKFPKEDAPPPAPAFVSPVPPPPTVTIYSSPGVTV